MIIEEKTNQDVATSLPDADEIAAILPVVHHEEEGPPILGRDHHPIIRTEASGLTTPLPTTNQEVGPLLPTTKEDETEETTETKTTETKEAEARAVLAATTTTRRISRRRGTTTTNNQATTRDILS